MQEARARSLGGETSLEEETATLSGILAWRIPWTEELEVDSPWGYKGLATTEHACMRTLKKLAEGRASLRS